MNRPSARYTTDTVHAMTTTGVTDLMTSLAIMFILLLMAYIAPSQRVVSEAQDSKEVQGSKQDLTIVLDDHFKRFGLALEADARDPLAILIPVRESLLNFEFGKSTLSSTANVFLTEAMPFYADVLCGALREKIDSFVIEGHTDDFGSDTLNLKLSQERSFSVMVRALEVIHVNQPSAYECFQQITSASGRGKQDLVYDTDHVLNREKSRRVMFKIRLRSIEQRSHALRQR